MAKQATRPDTESPPRSQSFPIRKKRTPKKEGPARVGAASQDRLHVCCLNCRTETHGPPEHCTLCPSCKGPLWPFWDAEAVPSRTDVTR